MTIEIGSSESTRSSLRGRWWSLLGVLLPWVILQVVSCVSVLAQQPTSTAPIFQANAQYLQGRTWADYKATAGTGLTLNIAAGQVWCSGTLVTYAAGTLTMTNAATNYVYLDTAASCVPAKSTSAWTATAIPLATVVAAGGAITTVTDNRSLLTAGGGGGGSGPDPSTPICYASYYGNDVNTGLTLATAKEHIMACYDALPATGGIIYIADGGGNSKMVYADTTSDVGIWIMGPDDPNYASPPAGWRKAKTAGKVNFVGITNGSGAQVGFHGGVTAIGGGYAGGSLVNPMIWLSSMNNAPGFYNLGYWYQKTGIKIGIDSDNVKTELAGVTSAFFSHISGNLGAAGAGYGPNVDIGPNTFWIYFYDSVFSGLTDVNGVLTQNGAAINIYPGPALSSAGHIYIENCGTFNGGIRYETGNTSALLYVKNLETESQTNGDAGVYIHNANGATLVSIDGVFVSDNSGTVPAVLVDGPSSKNAADGICVRNVAGGALSTIGPMNLSGCQYPGFFQDMTVLPHQEGVSGILGGRLWAQDDSARSNFSPTAVRYPNLVFSQLSTSWQKASGDVTFTTGKKAPDGTLNAVLVESTAAYQSGANFLDLNITTNVGDSYIAGVWQRSTTGNGTLNHDFAVVGSTCPVVGGKFLFQGDGEWEWIYVYCTVTAGSGSLEVRFRGQTQGDGANHVYSAEFYAPTLIHVPVADGLSANEIAQMAVHLSTYPEGIATTGTVATLRGQPFAFGGTGDNFHAILDHDALTANHTFKFPNVDGTVLTTGAAVSLAQGGTNQTSWTASRCVQVKADGTALESAAAACGAGGANHALLSATHTDTTAGAVVRGDIITGHGASPAWAALAKGNQYLSLTMGADEPGWTALALDQATATSGILGSAKGGTANGFTKFTGPTTSEKTFTLPDASTTVLTTHDLVTLAQGGTNQNSWTASRCVQVNAGGTALESAAGACGAGAGASTALDNLALVAINASLVPGAAATLNVGSAPLPWANAFFGNAANKTFTFGVSNLLGNRTMAVPDAAGIIPQAYSCTNQVATALNGTTGLTSCTTITSAYTSGTFSPSAHVHAATDVTSGILTSAIGGTANGFTKFTGPTTAEKTFTLPDASATVLTTNALVTSVQGGTGNGWTKFTGPTTAEKTFTLPDASATVLTTNALISLAQGGTNQNSWTASRCVQVNAGGTALESAAAACGTGGGITTLNTLTAATQTFANGTTGTAPNWASDTSTHTLHIPMASTASVTAGLISKTDYDTFNGKPNLIGSGTAGNGPGKVGDATTAARSNHDHRSIHELNWFFPGTPATGVQNMTLTFPEVAVGFSILDMRVTVATVSAASSTFNIQRCTANCTSGAVTFSDIYSTVLTLAANNRTVTKGSAPDQNVTSLVAGDQFRARLVTIGASLSDVTVTMTVKYDTTN